MLEFSIITISTFVTVLNELAKLMAELVFKKDIKKYIPILSILFGVILGVVGFYATDIDMGGNVIEAIFIGIAAGGAATGVNQIGKQLHKNDSLVDAKSLLDNVSVSELMDVVESSINIIDDDDVLTEEKEQTLDDNTTT